MQFKYKLGFIGAGNMAKAIVKGIISSKILNKDEILMSATSEGTYNDIKILSNNKYLIENCEKLVLAVKPQVFDIIKDEFKNAQNNLIISIMAAKNVNYLKSIFTNSDVIRVMPNTPCMVNQGMSVIATNNSKKENQLFVDNIFKSIGLIDYIDENLFDAVTSVSGSGPAYIYYFIKSMVQGGVNIGLSYDQSLKLTLQTMLGGIEMVKNTSNSLDDLITKVCSKGGTTIEAINTFNDNNMIDIITEGMLKCKRRSEELSK